MKELSDTSKVLLLRYSTSSVFRKIYDLLDVEVGPEGYGRVEDPFVSERTPESGAGEHSILH